MKYRPLHGIRFHVIMSLAPKSRGKYLSYQWTISYKNSFFVEHGTIRLVENMRPEKLNNEGSFYHDRKNST